EYLDHEAFDAAGIAVEYMDYDLSPYPQLHGAFEPYVTALDTVANLGPEAGAQVNARTVPWRDMLTRRAAAPRAAGRRHTPSRRPSTSPRASAAWWPASARPCPGQICSWWTTARPTTPAPSPAPPVRGSSGCRSTSARASPHRRATSSPCARAMPAWSSS